MDADPLSFLCCQVQQGALLDTEQMDSLKRHLEQLTRTNQMPGAVSSQDLLLTHLTLLQNVLRYGFHEEQYADICQAMPQALPHTLVSMLSWPDPWAGYLASKCAAFILAQPTMQKRVLLVAEEMITLLLAAPSLSHVWINILQVFNLIFSKKKLWPDKRTFVDIDDVQTQALVQLEKSWPLLRQTFHVSLTTHLHPPHVSVAFLSLWTKLLKFLRLQTADVSHMRSWQILDSTPSLLVYLRSPGLSVAVYNRIIDVCMQVLPCGGRESISASVKLRMSQTVVEAVDQGLLDYVPYQEGDVDFPGPDTLPPGDVRGEGSAPTEPTVKKRKQSDLTMRPSAVTLRKLTTFVLSCCTSCVQALNKSNKVLKNAGDMSRCLLSLWRWVCRWHCPREGVHWAVSALAEQDDRLVAAMMYLLEVHTAARFGKIAMGSPLTWKVINPHDVFLSFLRSTSYDHRLLLDLLISPETCFLLYLIRYLHYVVNCWQELVVYCQEREQELASKAATEVRPGKGKKQTEGSESSKRSVNGESDGKGALSPQHSLSDSSSVMMSDSFMGADGDKKMGNTSDSGCVEVALPEGLNKISTLALDDVANAEAVVAGMSNQLDQQLQQGEDLGRHLAGLLRQVSGQRLRLMEGPLVRDVATSQLELKRKQDHMAKLLKSAEDILNVSENELEDTSSNIEYDHFDEGKTEHKVLPLVSALYSSSSMDVDEEESIENIQGASDCDNQSYQLRPQPLVPTKFNTAGGNVKSNSVLKSSAWPTLTAYSDSEGDDGEEEGMATMIKGWTQYIDKTTDCASLMTIVGRLSLGEQPTKPLLDYPDSDSDIEQELYGKLAEAMVSNQEDISHELSCKNREELTEASDKSLIHHKPSSSSSSSNPNSVPESNISESDFSGSTETLDAAMTVLIRLRLAIERMAEKGIFPYNAEPLLRILMKVEACYEEEDTMQ